MIIAWHLHHLTYVTHAYPTVPCTAVFEVQEWQTIYLVQKHKCPPQKPPDSRLHIFRSYLELGCIEESYLV